MPSLAEQKEMIKEEGKVALITAFQLANEGKYLNFNLIKEYLFYVKIEKILPVKNDRIVKYLDFLGDHAIIEKFMCVIQQAYVFDK